MFAPGEYGSWTETVGVKVDIDPAIQILSQKDHPLTSRISDGPLAANVKVEWLEEDLTPQEATPSTVTGTSTPWTCAFTTVTDAGIFRVGDVLWLKDGAETTQFLVTSVDVTAGEIVVAGFAGNTTVDPTTTSPLRIIGQYRPEGGTPEAMRSVGRSTNYNYTQIWEEGIEATRTARTLGARGMNYGQGDPYAHELGKKVVELGIRMERNNILGVRAISANKKNRSAGGLFNMVGSTNSVSGVKATLVTKIEDLVQAIEGVGGEARILMCSFPLLRAISAAYNASTLRTTLTDRTGGTIVNHIVTNFGEIDVVGNRHFPLTRYAIPDMRFVSRRVVDGLSHSLLPQDGDGDHGHIIGEWTTEWKNEKAHGVGTCTDVT